jgi:ubiquinone/menaquinone biosynthesis C-methylase UbiE
MKIRRYGRCLILVVMGMFIIGLQSFLLESNPKKAGFQKSAQAQKPIRPDLDENDLWRDRRFDMDGIMDDLDIQPGMQIADVGAGEGYLTFKLARRVSPNGKVFAEDIKPEALELLRIRASERGLTNIETILGTEYDPRLPPGELDMIFMHAVIQFIADRPLFVRMVSAGLKERGRFVIIEPENKNSAAQKGVIGPGQFPTRKGYLEIFRQAGLVLISAGTRKDRLPTRIGSSEKTIFVLKLAPKSPGVDLEMSF